jgi:hypothetical protein
MPQASAAADADAALTPTALSAATAGYAPFSIRELLQYDLLDKLERLQALGGQARGLWGCGARPPLGSRAAEEGAYTASIGWGCAGPLWPQALLGLTPASRPAPTHTRPQASKEAGLEKALAKMKADWQGVAFRVVAYKEPGTFVIGGTDDVQASGLGLAWTGFGLARVPPPPPTGRAACWPWAAGAPRSSSCHSSARTPAH